MMQTNTVRLLFLVVAIGHATYGVVASVSAASLPADSADSVVVVAPAPQGEELSGDYTVTVNGQSLPVYRCRVSAFPLNQVWPGYQRPLEQTELASFGYWDMGGPARVLVIAKQPPKTVAIRPTRLGIKPAVDGRQISFTLARPAHFTVEIDGTHHALHLFASPLEEKPPKPGDPGVRYFGPGIHHAGEIVLQSNQTVYLAAGAVVHGHIVARDAKNIRILGRGILDASTFERPSFAGMISFVGCRDALADGIILRDPLSWTVIPAGSQGVRINNLKLIGLWRYNSDGIDVVNSRDVAITNCFIRSFDDSLVIKGMKRYEQHPISNITASGCVIWNDWGKAIAVGPETCAPEIADLVFRDCDIIRTNNVAMDVHGGDRAKIRNVRFENIRLEIDPVPLRPRLQTQRDQQYEADPKDSFCPWLSMVNLSRNSYSQDTELGSIDGVYFKDIYVTGKCIPGSHVAKPKAPHSVEGVKIEGVWHNGQKIR